MKRDMELVRKLLLAVEAHDSPDKTFDIENTFPDYPLEVVMYHVKILDEAGLVDATDASDSRKIYYMPNGLTWNGHEFLDAIRNDTVWNKVKQVIQEKGGAIPFALMQALALSFAKSHFGLN